MQEKCLFVLNPKSGRGKALKVWPKIEEAIQSQHIEYKHVVTEAKFHAAELVKQGIEAGYRRIISVGGDGTLHECLNGIYAQQSVDPKTIKLGIFPVGTGNDWIKSHPVPENFEDWINYLVSNKTVSHDVGKVTYMADEAVRTRFFINIAGLGFEAAAVERACRGGSELLGGKIYYLLVVAQTLFSYKSQNMIITIDGKPMQDSYFCVTIGLNKFNGGGMQLLPNADSSDGYFDVAIIEDISVGEVLLNLTKLYNGKIVHHPKVKSIKANTITISSEEHVLLESDGEFLGSTEVSFEIIHPGVQIIQP